MNNPQSGPVFDGDVVVIAGGAGLLGSSFARAVAEHGGVAVVADQDQVAGKAWRRRYRGRARAARWREPWISRPRTRFKR